MGYCLARDAWAHLDAWDLHIIHIVPLPLDTCDLMLNNIFDKVVKDPPSGGELELESMCLYRSAIKELKHKIASVQNIHKTPNAVVIVVVHHLYYFKYHRLRLSITICVGASSLMMMIDAFTPLPPRRKP